MSIEAELNASVGEPGGVFFFVFFIKMLYGACRGFKEYSSSRVGV